MAKKKSASGHQSSYLSRVSLTGEMKRDGIWKYITNMRIVLLLLITILFLGAVSYSSIPRRLNPEIKIPIVSIVTVLSGASPRDVESLVTVPLETALQNVRGIDTMTSVSRDNVSIISMQFISSVSQDKAKSDVQSAVDGVTNLPSDANTPSVKALDFEDQPIWTFALQSKDGDTPSLMRVAHELKTNLEQTEKVDRVTVNGFDTQIVSVSLSPQKIMEYGINPLALAGAVKSALVSYPAGTLESAANTFSLSIDPAITSVTALRELRISVSGKQVKLGDIATVMERSAPNQTASYLATPDNAGEKAVTVSVYKISGANIDAAQQSMQKTVDETLAAYDGRISVRTIINTAEEITTQFTDLLGEFRSTIILVFGCLFVFLGLRQALISSITVPLTFLCAFIFMQYFGMSINFLSLFAFLLALGLLVDDTIVVVSAMTTYFKTKRFSPQETGRVVWKDTIVPIWSTTATTIWSFVPLLLSSGIIGEFIKPIPVVVTVTMISSTGIAVLLTLPFMIVLLKPSIPARVVKFGKFLAGTLLVILFISVFKSNPLFVPIAILFALLWWVVSIVGSQVIAAIKSAWDRRIDRTARARFAHIMDNGLISIDTLSQAYYRLITRILNSAWARKFVISTIVLYSLLAFILVPLGFVKNEFFPKSDEDVVYVNLSMPSGTNVTQTDNESKQLLEKLRHTKGIQFVTSDVGVSVAQSFSGRSSGTSLASFTLHLIPKDHRKISSLEVAENVRQMLADYTRGDVSVVEVSGGPPAGADLQMTLLGDDLGILNGYADKLVSYLDDQKGVLDAKKSITPGTSKVTFVPDQDKLLSYGLSTDAVGLWLRTFASGFTLSDAKYEKEATDKKDIVFQFGDGMQTLDEVGELSIPKAQGSIPIGELGTLIVDPNPAAITRDSGKRSLTVSASVASGYNATELNSGLESYASTLEMQRGYSWKTGGVNDENRKSVISIMQAMGLAFILILVTMVVQFQSYRQAVIVLMVIPLAVSSVFVVFALTGTPLSFPALIGVLSLFGIVVTNSMFIVDKINLNLKEKMPFIEAIADAGASRMEPIILTKLCTVFGLLPITMSNALWRGLGGAIISGILIASTIMLLFIPAVYYEWMHEKKK